jgi:triacylglycerol lipase
MFSFSFNLKDHAAWLSSAKPGRARPKPVHPVILVPGYRDNARVFQRLTRYLKARHFDVHTLTLRPSDGRLPLNQLAEQVADYVETTFAPEQVLDFVGFSMGGIVLRYYLQRLGGLARADHFITLGSPHRGTWMAYYSSRPGVLQMRPRSPFLLDLAQDEDQLSQIRFISIWTPLDLTIVPSSSSVTSVGQHQRLMLPYHRALVTDGRSLQRVAQALLEPVHTPLES